MAHRCLANICSNCFRRMALGSFIKRGISFQEKSTVDKYSHLWVHKKNCLWVHILIIIARLNTKGAIHHKYTPLFPTALLTRIKKFPKKQKKSESFDPDSFIIILVKYSRQTIQQSSPSPPHYKSGTRHCTSHPHSPAPFDNSPAKQPSPHNNRSAASNSHRQKD